MATTTDLTGSDKQIQWASEIRDAALERFSATPVQGPMQAIYARIVEDMQGQSDSSWWIDRRSALEHPMQYVQDVILERGEDFGVPADMLSAWRGQFADARARAFAR